MNSLFFVARVPLFPIEIIFEKEKIDVYFKNPAFKEAILLSSPVLFEQLERYLSGGIGLETDRKKVRNSLYRFLLRMSYRCTPFGLFAGIAHGFFKQNVKPEITLSDIQQHRKFSRLDNHLLGLWIATLEDDFNIRNNLKWFPNNTIYHIANKIRYVDFKVVDGVRAHSLVNIENSEYLEKLLKRSDRGFTIQNLVNDLACGEIGIDEAEEFVNELIQNRLLLSEININITGEPFQERLYRILKNSNSNHYLFLETAISFLKKIDSQAIGNSVDELKALHKYIESACLGEVESRMFVQTDLSISTENCSLDNSLLKQIEEVVIFLMRFNRRSENETLKKFKDEFYKRYEVSEVALTEVLDADIGIGYPVGGSTVSDIAPLLKGVSFKENTNLFSGNPFSNRVLFELLLNASKEGKQIVDLSQIQFLNNSKEEQNELLKQLPQSLYSVCSILSYNSSEKECYNLLYDHSVGPSSVNLLGRFCHLSHKLKESVISSIEIEEKNSPEVIFAEIVHAPQNRHGNILMRPQLREYEIPILATSGVKPQNIILLDDLLISLEENEIVLKSKRLNKRVIPRMSTAHNYSFNSLPQYNFLCDLQTQEFEFNLSWDWGTLASLKFLPRIVYKKVILSLAQWTFSRSFFFDDNAKLDFLEFSSKFTKAVAKMAMPKLVVLASGDNQIPLNLENSLSLEILLEEFKKSETIILKEFPYQIEDFLIKSKEGKFTNEIIIPWSNNYSTSLGKVNFSIASEVERKFFLGREWLYFKIYCSVKTADKLLIDIFQSVTDDLLTKNVITKWFFIRYADPDHHIRIRFSGQGNFYAEVIERLNKAFAPYLQNHLIWKVQTDTYNRELERYGLLNIENSETLFFHDSIACTEILSMLEGDEGDDLRWQLAMKGVDDLLNSFGLDLAAKKELMSIISANFLKEFNGDNVETNRQLSAKYRNEKAKIHIALQSEMEESHEFFPVWQLFAERSKNIAPCVQHINKLIEQNKLEVSKPDLLASYIHMFLNRFLRSKQRLQEMVIYDLLRQHYRSILARQSNEALSSLK
jgi:lantibiotic biosynthesis protein